MNFEVFPLIIGWELTLECNMRCRHCGSTAGAKRPNELTTKEALDLCDQFPDLLVQEVDITGGEPLLRKDWTIIAGHLQDLGIPVNILTNGLVMDSEMIAKMKELDIRAVGLSIDGLREVHDRFRNYRGSYEKTLNAMRLMQEAGIKYNIITTVNKENLGQLPAMHDVFRDLGVRHWRLQPLIPMGRALQNPGLELNDEDMLALGNFIRKQAADPDPVNPDIMCSDGLEYVKPGIGGPWRGCPGGIISCGIMSDGRVKGCLSLPDEVCEGNIRDRDLWDIWFDPASFAYTRYFNQEDAGPLCTGCEKLGDCQGGCSSSSYTGTGIFHNDPVCFFRAEHNQNKFT
ncbi:Radical SAM domain protein [Methanolacinia petrolearia DSM 11571]|uniref:Radical SAM domain protein n=1 Tax=Methanolacinia petrolearia (strain DSM 11571 / OCM 486 / SEBR 4847) TaxID=679926 RepID=E1REZ4_METP4|nr:radical SAM protein [Methanolacinia petrolearia]ADN37238.1 Radical SAM domain protein [Methanolacinia petrolearia DSM 11571]